jgi:hypothetical protein
MSGSSGVCRCSRRVIGGAMHAIACLAKTMTSRDRPSSVMFSFRWCIDKKSPFGVVVLRRCPTTVETWLRSLA